MTIVVGYVSTKEGRAALDRAVEEAKLRGRRLVVVHSDRGGSGFTGDNAASQEATLQGVRDDLAGSGVDLRTGDMASSFGDLDGTVDVVVSNPPYIPLEAYESVTPEVRDHDPSLALWSGEDGLDAIRVVERVAARLLVPGGVVGVEHAEVQAQAAPAVFAATGRWVDVRDHEDLAGRARFVTARLAARRARRRADVLRAAPSRARAPGRGRSPRGDRAEHRQGPSLQAPACGARGAGERARPDRRHHGRVGRLPAGVPRGVRGR